MGFKFNLNAMIKRAPKPHPGSEDDLFQSATRKYQMLVLIREACKNEPAVMDKLVGVFEYLDQKFAIASSREAYADLIKDVNRPLIMVMKDALPHMRGGANRRLQEAKTKGVLTPDEIDFLTGQLQSLDIRIANLRDEEDRIIILVDGQNALCDAHTVYRNSDKALRERRHA